MKHLMDRQVSNFFGQNIIDFPIKENANIINGNALRVEWENVDYILGNPPFIGKKFMSPEQKDDLKTTFPKKMKIGTLDYITAWFYKASFMAKNNVNIKIAFVSTNSITQGEQVGILWKLILDKNECKIDFGYRTFKWDNEAKEKAAVHCVVIGFSNKKNSIESKKIYLANGEVIEAKNINGYLINSEDVFIERRTNHIQNLLKMEDGNVPIDGNFLKVEPEEYEEFKLKEPQALKYIKKLVGGDNFISKKPRYVLWLVDVSISELRKMPLVSERVKKVREFRLNSDRKATIKLADTPTLFEDRRNPEKALIIPRVSSEKRKYIPIGFIDKTTIALNQVILLSDAGQLEFSILTSSVHMAWVRAIAGRMKSDYRYSVSVVYNNFPFPELDNKMKEKLEKAGQNILDIREKYPNDSYADLYDDTFMPIDLRKAHQENDKAVWEAYGKKWEFGNEEECVSYLMKLYSELVR